jgi:RNA polymerase sigma-70 factor (ECF subfamily)
MDGQVEAPRSAHELVVDFLRPATRVESSGPRREREQSDESGRVMVTETQISPTQQIWAEFGERLRAFIGRRVDSEADADDILQDVFLRIHRRAGTVEHSERLVSWLFQVTRNAIADFYRSSVRRREFPVGETPDLDASWQHARDGVDDSDVASPEVRHELAACLGPMMAQLSPLYREAVTLIDLDELPQKEAAARSGITISGMKSRVRRGRQALEQLFHDCCQIETDATGQIMDYQPRGTGCGSCGDGCATT